MSVTCHIDNTRHDSIEALHRYIRPKMKQETYYTQFLAKKDPVTGEPIPFKNAEQYLSQDFFSKDTLRRWMRTNPAAGQEWAKNWLKKRKEEKELIYAPSQVELRSLDCPSMHFYEPMGGYYDVTRALGFKDRYAQYVGQKSAIAANIDDLTIICDTREQLPLKLTAKTIREKLNCGDYGLAAPYDRGVYIERKSLNDLIGTLNQRTTERIKKDLSVTTDSSFDRFDRELARAADNGHYIVMVVECLIEEALSFDENPDRLSRVSSAHVFYNLRALLAKYPLNFQAVFANGRKESARVVHKILSMGHEVKHIDLEYALERRVL